MASLGFSSAAHTAAIASHAPVGGDARAPRSSGDPGADSSSTLPSGAPTSSLSHTALASNRAPGPYLPSIIVHGGAGWISDERAAVCVAGVNKAARAGYEVLMRGGTAVDAVEAAVRYVVFYAPNNMS